MEDERRNHTVGEDPQDLALIVENGEAILENRMKLEFTMIVPSRPKKTHSFPNYEIHVSRSRFRTDRLFVMLPHSPNPGTFAIKNLTNTQPSTRTRHKTIGTPTGKVSKSASARKAATAFEIDTVMLAAVKSCLKKGGTEMES